MTDVIRPPRLTAGDRVAIIATSWPGSTVHPHVHRAGLQALRERFGLETVEYPSTGFSPEYAAAHPRERAADLNRAFADPSISAIVTVVGGDDSVRILPHIDVPVARSNPKILLGYSDTTTQLLWLAQAGLVTFNGPAVMAGLAQLDNLPGLEAHIRSMLFEPTGGYDYRPYPYWVGNYPNWRGQDGTRVGPVLEHEGWHWLQGSHAARGRLTGGCIEVLDMMLATPWWPQPDYWDDRILFLETSEDKPTVSQVGYWLRNFGAQGILNRIAGLVIGRPRDYTPAEKDELNDVVLARLAEWDATDIPVVAGVDFGHTDPQLILPHNVLAELDPDTKRFRLLESAVL